MHHGGIVRHCSPHAGGNHSPQGAQIALPAQLAQSETEDVAMELEHQLHGLDAVELQHTLLDVSSCGRSAEGHGEGRRGQGSICCLARPKP